MFSFSCGSWAIYKHIKLAVEIRESMKESVLPFHTVWVTKHKLGLSDLQVSLPAELPYNPYLCYSYITIHIYMREREHALGMVAHVMPALEMLRQENYY